MCSDETLSIEDISEEELDETVDSENTSFEDLV